MAKNFKPMTDESCRCAEKAASELGRVAAAKRAAAVSTNKYADDGGGNGSLPDSYATFRSVYDDGAGNGSLPD